MKLTNEQKMFIYLDFDKFIEELYNKFPNNLYYKLDKLEDEDNPTIGFDIVHITQWTTTHKTFIWKLNTNHDLSITGEFDLLSPLDKQLLSLFKYYINELSKKLKI